MPQAPKLNSNDTPCPSANPIKMESGVHLDKALLDACIHCGLCLPACPTYLATGREMESPRGRIYLLSLLNQGEEKLSSRLSEHIDSCLGCLGCQTACPSGVNYGHILEEARGQNVTDMPHLLKVLLRATFAWILPNYVLLRLGGKALRIWRRLFKIQGAPAGEHATARGGIFSRLAELQSFLPLVPPHRALPSLYARKAPAPEGEAQLFAGCVMDIFYNHVNHAALRLLAAQGRLVRVPEQTCCGALALHAGFKDIALRLAKRNIQLLEGAQGPITVTSAGCGAMLKGYGHLLKEDPDWATRASTFANRVEDISQTLAQGTFPICSSTEQSTDSLKVAYHAACHLVHAQGVRVEPVRLLERLCEDLKGIKPPVKKIELVPLAEAEHCCGSAGIYNLIHTDLSLEVLSRKMDCLEKSACHIVVTGNPGCLLQLEKGVRDRNLDIEVVHICQFLDQYYAGEGSL